MWRSCLAETLRANGLAARLVSGYLRETDAESRRAEGSLHAWTEVFLPGAGWVGMDGTNGVFCNHNFIAAAVGLRPADITPISGSYYHSGKVAAEMTSRLELFSCVIGAGVRLHSVSVRAGACTAMLTELQLRNFRCFDALRVEFAPGFNFFIGQNGEGKTSILEAACVLLRLQSQRSSTLAPLIRISENDPSASQVFATNTSSNSATALCGGSWPSIRLEQKGVAEYLRIGAGRFDGEYRHRVGARRLGIPPALSRFSRRADRTELSAELCALTRSALRSRNALLKSSTPKPRELAAYDPPLLEHGAKLSAMRARTGRALELRSPPTAHREISGMNETLRLRVCAR